MNIKRYKYPFSLLTIVLCIAIACASGDSRSNFREATSPAASVMIRIAETDTMFRSLVFDTSMRFSSALELTGYWKIVQSRYFDAKSALSYGEKKYESIELTLDSLNYMNSQLLAYAGLRFLQSKKNKTAEDLFLLNASAALKSNLYDEDDVMRVLDDFPEQVKSSPAALAIYRKIKTGEKTVFSFRAIADLSVFDSLNRSWKIDELVSNDVEYTLLIFGASWCKPCRLENHYLNQMMLNKELNNVRLLGISVDTRRQAWIDAIRKDQCSWSQYNVPLGMEAALSKAVNLTGVPHNILLNKNGEVVMQTSSIEKVIDYIRRQ